MEPNFLRSTNSSFSSLSSSDLDTESTLSFFPDNSITLGTLIGFRPDPPPRRSLSSVHPMEQAQIEVFGRRTRQTGNQRGWWDFMRCAGFKDGTDDGMSSLGHFLQAERRAGGSTGNEKVYINIMYEEADGFVPEANPLFVESLLGVPSTRRGLPGDLPVIIEESPRRSLRSTTEDGRNHNRALEAGNIEYTTQALHQRSISESSSCAFHCVSNIWGW